MSASAGKDLLQRFLFPDLGCRGEFVRLCTSWQELLSRSTYPASVENALGQSLAAIALLSATIKFDGSLSLQINGDGPVNLLLVQARANGGLRGLARFDGERLAESRFERVELGRLPGLTERNRDAGAAGASRASNPMSVALHGLG